MKQQAVIIDPFSKDSYHEVINACYAMMIADCYDQVRYISSNSSIAVIKKFLTEISFAKKIDFESKYFLRSNGNKGRHGLLNYLLTSIYDVFYYLKAPRHADVFFNGNIYFAIPVISMLSRFVKKQAFILCHGELKIMLLTDTRNTYKIMQKYFNFAFKKISLSRYINFILLGDDLKETLVQELPAKNKNRIHSLEHAYIRPTVSIENFTPLPQTKKYKIGIPSLISKDTGLQNLDLFLETSCKEASLYAFSRVDGEIKNKDNVILYNISGKLLEYKEYANGILQMDALLFVYDAETYKLTASGAILEAIWYQKPIIALDNEYFSYLFKKYGEMGVLCKTIDELSAVFQNLDNFFEKKNYFIHNMIYARNALLPTNVAPQLRAIIEQGDV